MTEQEITEAITTLEAALWKLKNTWEWGQEGAYEDTLTALDSIGQVSGKMFNAIDNQRMEFFTEYGRALAYAEAKYHL